MSCYRLTVITMALLLSAAAQTTLAAGKPFSRRAQLPPSQPTSEPAPQKVDDVVTDQSLLDEVQLKPVNGITDCP